MTTHSPGPWRFGPNAYQEFTEQPATYRGEGFAHHPCIVDANGETVAGCDEYDVFSRYHGTDNADAAMAERAANVRLLLAAPDLLAASQSLLDHYVELASSGDAGYWDPEREDQVIAMRAAIAKATGEPVNAQ